VTTPLDGPLEMGLRVLAILDVAYPNDLDIDALSLLDYVTMHSGDFAGPTSLLPALPLRQSELTLRRQGVKSGLEVLLRSHLVELGADGRGLTYVASDSSSHFVEALHNDFWRSLRARARWAHERFGSLEGERVSDELARIIASHTVDADGEAPT